MDELLYPRSYSDIHSFSINFFVVSYFLFLYIFISLNPPSSFVRMFNLSTFFPPIGGALTFMSFANINVCISIGILLNTKAIFSSNLTYNTIAIYSLFHIKLGSSVAILPYLCTPVTFERAKFISVGWGLATIIYSRLMGVTITVNLATLIYTRLMGVTITVNLATIIYKMDSKLSSEIGSIESEMMDVAINELWSDQDKKKKKYSTRKENYERRTGNPENLAHCQIV
uniref:Uncharacterized protein n=2 Tax=Cacopsylla melanoneura TaxID=428564 RepID=A0A8D8YDW7_9HEMI